MDPWNGGWWFWPFGWIFLVILIFLIMRLVFWRRRGWWGGPWGHPYYGGGVPPGHVPAEEILRQRLAKGEIDEAEYNRLKEVLSK
jgi:uncharacterized membrane protein